MTIATTPASAMSNPTADQLREKLVNKTATIGVVGLGYVGLPLVRALHDAGYKVLGFDVDQRKIDKLLAGESYLKHLGDELVAQLAKSNRFRATSDGNSLGDADVILLCVPTPLGHHHEPDLTFVLDSTRLAAKTLRKGQLIVLESTTYPGTTRDEMGPILEASGLRSGVDFFLAYSPEREDPGRAGFTTSTIPKLVGGCDEISGDLAMELYTRIIQKVYRVRSAEIAEAAKLLENIYRAVNIAMVNELKTVLTPMNIDIWEVIDAASTKPFGFQAFYPGPGLGGHCIPIDPFYLTWKAKEVGQTTRFIELAGEINRAMPRYVVNRVIEALNERERSLRGAKVLVMGIAYKPNIDDMRESPAAEIIELLYEHGAKVDYHDPHCPVFPHMRRYTIDLKSVDLSPDRVKGYDCVLIVTDHSKVDYAMIGECAKLIIDTRNAMARIESPKAPIIKA